MSEQLSAHTEAFMPVEERLKNGVKVAIIGAPNTGKSVFLDGLLGELGPEAGRIDASHGDGEGGWYQEHYSDPHVQSLRRKLAGFSEDPVSLERTIEQIQGFNTPLMLINMGGKINSENARILSHATHAIILASNAEDSVKYKAAADSAGLSTVAVLRSELNGQETVASHVATHVLHGEVSGLRRGTSRTPRFTAEAVADELRRIRSENVWYESKQPADSLSLQACMETLGYADRFDSSGVRPLNAMLTKGLAGRSTVTIRDRAQVLTYEAAALAADDAGVSEIYVLGLDGRVRIDRLPQVAAERTEHKGLLNISRFQERGAPVLVHAQPQVSKLSPSVLSQLRVPMVPERRDIVISGRIPQWLAASLALTYKDTADAVAAFVPGQPSTVIWARDLNRLGEPVVLSDESLAWLTDVTQAR